MTNKKQNGAVKGLAQIVEAIDACVNALIPYATVCAGCGDTEAEDDGEQAVLEEALTLLQVASERLDYVAWMRSPEGKKSHAEHTTAS